MSKHAPRGYQERLEQACYASWQAGNRNVMAVLPTGGGKTFVFSRVAAAAHGVVVAAAHRAELVSQMSVALGREGVRHRIIGSATTRKEAASQHLEEFGRIYLDPNARVAAASVDTLVGMKPNDPLLQAAGLCIMDEGHHVLKDNKWGRAFDLMPNAYGLAVTATPIRADGKGLGRHADGLMDDLIVGPSMRDLISDGYLTDYDVVCPQSDLDLSEVTVTASGDYSPEKLKKARRKSHITGDVVENYIKFAKGRLAVVFDVDVESAGETAKAFRAAGIRAEAISAKTPASLRASLLRQLRRREVQVLVNVDLFGEGFDLPAIEVVVMARPTMSYSLYCQQFGRALRIMEGKHRALIIDHVGNIVRHGLPDAPRSWSLDRRERRSRSNDMGAIPLRTCLNPECLSVYERVLVACPHCGHTPPVAERSSPEKVDGDLMLLDPEVLKRMRGEVLRRSLAPFYPTGATAEVVAAINKRHLDGAKAQTELGEAIALWAGWQRHLGRSDQESYRRFYYQFNVDVLTAQAQPAQDMRSLAQQITSVLQAHNVRSVYQ